MNCISVSSMKLHFCLMRKLACLDDWKVGKNDENDDEWDSGKISSQVNEEFEEIPGIFSRAFWVFFCQRKVHLVVQFIPGKSWPKSLSSSMKIINWWRHFHSFIHSRFFEFPFFSSFFVPSTHRATWFSHNDFIPPFRIEARVHLTKQLPMKQKLESLSWARFGKFCFGMRHNDVLSGS